MNALLSPLLLLLHFLFFFFFSIAKDTSLLQAEHPSSVKCKQMKVAIPLNNGKEIDNP